MNLVEMDFKMLPVVVTGDVVLYARHDFFEIIGKWVFRIFANERSQVLLHL